MLSIAGQRRELGIMRALGAKPKEVLKIILTQTLLVTLISGGIGVLGGLLVIFSFLIPEPVISLHSIAVIAASILLALFLLILAGLYPGFKFTKSSIVDIISSPQGG